MEVAMKWGSEINFSIAKVSLRTKGKFDKTDMACKSAMMYGLDCWTLNKRDKIKIEVAEMRMLK